MDLILKYGICGDGLADDWRGLQELLDSGEREIRIPQGCYLVGRTLKIHSGTRIIASPNARFVMNGAVNKRRGDFLITNCASGSENISITGGVWDGNNEGKGNEKPDIFDKQGYSGVVINFAGVRGLELTDITVANSVTYNVRLSDVNGFRIENIGFVSDRVGHNQDGLHFGGAVRNGTVKNVRALSKGQTNDDLIALNADDSVERVENLDVVRAAIENVDIENLFAEDCHTIIRLLSVDAPIRNVKIKNVYGGYRCFAVNADAARYCRTPLFNDSDRPFGVGRIENVSIENITAYPTRGNAGAAVCMESLAVGFKIKNFRLIDRNGIAPVRALEIKNVKNVLAKTDKETFSIKDKSFSAVISEFRNLEINPL